MSVSREQRHLRGHPCPVCGGKDEDPRGKEVRCSGFTSREGMWCRCSREELAGAIDQDKDGLFRHMMRGPCDCGVTHGERREGPGPEAVYRYTDEEDRTIFEVVRFPGKKIRQRVPDGSGGYSWKLNGARRTLYRLPALLLDAGSTVYVVEGEKDADTLARAGLLATTNPHGAGKWHTVQEHAATVLRDRVVVVIADADEPGRDHARNVVRCLRRVARSVRLTECPSPHKDVSDLYAAGGTVADLLDTPLEPRPALAPEPEPVSADRWDDESEGPASAPVRRASIAAPRLRVKAEVQVSMVDIHETIDQTIDVMRADPRLFVRAHELVTVIGADAGDALISKGSPIIRPHCHSSLLPRLTRHCSFMRYQPPSKKAVEAEGLGAPPAEGTYKPGIPPAQLVSCLLAAGEWPGLRPLTGVTESPMLRPDGSVLQVAGYDDATGYLYTPASDYPPVPDLPSQGDARRALEDLQAVFVDFPYVDRAHSMVPIACILTLLSRAAIDGSVPAFIFDASTRGSGKTLQADVVALVATGRQAARQTYPQDDEELDKMLASYALMGAPLVLLDNITRTFGGGSIDLKITARGDVEFRMLGRNEIRRLPWATVILASGNNVAFAEDTLRRILVARLESPLETPEDRSDFAHEDLPRWVRSERPRLVAAALTILRAYTAHGAPSAGCKRWGSFEEWSRLIPHALVFAGGADPMLARPTGQRAMSDEMGALLTVFRDLPRLTRAPISAREMLSNLYPAPRQGEPPDGWDELREAVEVMCATKLGQTPTAKVLGERLRRAKGRVLDGRSLGSEMDAHSKVLKWTVSPAGTTPQN